MLIRQPRKVSRAALGLAFLWCLTLIMTGLTAPGGARAADSRYFPETQHTVSGKFLDYWNTHGGLPVFGYPITDPQNEVDPETGKTFLTQWFERNRFELHPENAGTKYEVLLGLLGKDLRRDALTTDPDFKPAQPLAGQTYYKETGHNLGGSFLTYWQQNGGLERFGFPISEEHSEVDPETGKTFVSQWFERARFEHHPENQPPYDTLLGLLGKEIKLGKPVTGPVSVDWTLEPQTIASRATLAADRQGNIYSLNYYANSLYRRFVRYVVNKYNQAGQIVARIPNNTAYPVWSGLTVDSQGNVYVGTPADDQGTAHIFKYDSQGNLTLSWAEPKITVYPSNISALATDSHDNLFVANAGNQQINKYDNQGHLLATLSRDNAFSFITLGFLDFQDLKVDQQDNLYVVDGQRGQVYKFDNQGHRLYILGVQFFWPASLVVDQDNNFYVAQDRLDPPGTNSVIQKFSPAGLLLDHWGAEGEADGQFARISSLALDAQNHLLIADNKTYLQKFTLAGQFQGRFAQSDNNQPGCAANLGLDQQGNIYVIDNVAFQVEKYNSSGQFLSHVFGPNPRYSYSRIGLPGDFALDRTGSYFYIFDYDGNNHKTFVKYDLDGHRLADATLDDGRYGLPERGTAVNKDGNLFVVKFTPSSKTAPITYIDEYNQGGQLVPGWNNGQGVLADVGTPGGIDTDSQGNVYIAGSKQVIKFSPTGQILARWGNSHSADGNFAGAGGLAVDSQGYVYLADAANNRILKFDGQGQLVAKWSGATGQFRQPDGLKLDKAGNIYITSGCSIQKLRPQSNPVN